jgi:hypothetical protein
MKRLCIGLLLGFVLASSAWGEHPQDFLNIFSEQAKQDNHAFSGCVSSRGEQFFKTRHGEDNWSCASCHTDNPTAPGKHAVTGKPLEPLAPSANAERFTNPAKVDKWFKRSCKDVLQRECTAAEKGDVLAYLLALNP